MTSSYDKNALVNALLGNSTLPTPEPQLGSLLRGAEFGLPRGNHDESASQPDCRAILDLFSVLHLPQLHLRKTL